MAGDVKELGAAFWICKTDKRQDSREKDLNSTEKLLVMDIKLYIFKSKFFFVVI
jgi:hypothetical protein